VKNYSDLKRSFVEGMLLKSISTTSPVLLPQANKLGVSSQKLPQYSLPPLVSFSNIFVGQLFSSLAFKSNSLTWPSKLVLESTPLCEGLEEREVMLLGATFMSKVRPSPLLEHISPMLPSSNPSQSLSSPQQSQAIPSTCLSSLTLPTFSPWRTSHKETYLFSLMVKTICSLVGCHFTNSTLLSPSGCTPHAGLQLIKSQTLMVESALPEHNMFCLKAFSWSEVTASLCPITWLSLFFLFFLFIFCRGLLSTPSRTIAGSYASNVSNGQISMSG